jgi:4-hydroxy-3-polyprenylbenzoate decarboxylase
MPMDATHASHPSPHNRTIVAITGASGAIYARRLVEVLLAAGAEVHLSISPAGQQVLQHELGCNVDLDTFDAATLLTGEASIDAAKTQLHYHHFRNLMAPIASGSFLAGGMVVFPCSGGTLSAVVHGTSDNLIHRAAEVQLKERRKLILVPRETPLSLVALDNLRRAAEVGAVVLPAMPGFYHGPQTIADLVDFVVARICDQLGVATNLIRRWGE